MIPLLAIFAVGILGATALATDLSVSTHYKRSVQNVTDAAALAAAKLLPVSPTTGFTGDQGKAMTAALQVVHNAYAWGGAVPNWQSFINGGTCGASGCSITVCTSGTTITCPAGAKTVTASGVIPFVLTVNTPPLTARVPSFNGDVHRVEVVMSQQSGAFYAGAFGKSTNNDAAQSVAYHFAAGQPFGFALFSRKIVASGNQGETVYGNVYADRNLDPQSHGKAGVCAAPDPVTNKLSFIFLGSPQQGQTGYQGDGQASILPQSADPILRGQTCPAPGGYVEMSANPQTNSDCNLGFPGNNSSSTITLDTADGACEATPAITPPPVAAPPNIPVYGSTVCGNGGVLNNKYTPNEYKCNSGAALTVNLALTPGIYEIDAGNNGGCDVQISDPAIPLTGITFYLKGGAGMCLTIGSGQHITQTPYNAGTGAAGDDKYAVLSDNALTPSIRLISGGNGSSSGWWDVTGTIWLPTGTITFSNKAALQDSGQIICYTWDDSSGDHANSSISYNAAFAPQQNETLQLSE